MKWFRGLGSLDLPRGSRSSMEESQKTVKHDYDAELDSIREREYPMLKDTVYLDHAGATIYAKSLMDRFSQDMISNLYGNPHSASPSAMRSTRRVEDARLRVLRFFQADPEHFDLVFVANATAGIKVVMEGLRAHNPKAGASTDRPGYWYGYHGDAHTSLVGIRQHADRGQYCFKSDEEVDAWLSPADDSHHHKSPDTLGLFAYPAQSNMNARRLPRDWPRRLRQSTKPEHQNLFSLLDAAALVSTSPLDLSDDAAAPDFTVLSFYKIFGFPNLGALIVRKESGHLLQRRAYFGGGTVDMVSCLEEPWHISKSQTIHETLEDGTLPFHSIMALDAAMTVHRELYGSMDNISRHTGSLAKHLYEGMSSLQHANGRKMCHIYKDPASTYGDGTTQGASIAFNLCDTEGQWIGKSEVEELAASLNIHIRTGGLCNPGGIARFLDLNSKQLRENYDEGVRCGDDTDVLGGKPTGVIRVSLGAMSSMHDVEVFIAFLHENYTNYGAMKSEVSSSSKSKIHVFEKTLSRVRYFVESLMLFKKMSPGTENVVLTTHAQPLL